MGAMVHVWKGGHSTHTHYFQFLLSIFVVQVVEVFQLLCDKYLKGHEGDKV